MGKKKSQRIAEKRDAANQAALLHKELMSQLLAVGLEATSNIVKAFNETNAEHVKNHGHLASAETDTFVLEIFDAFKAVMHIKMDDADDHQKAVFYVCDSDSVPAKTLVKKIVGKGNYEKLDKLWTAKPTATWTWCALPVRRLLDLDDATTGALTTLDRASNQIGPMYLKAADHWRSVLSSRWLDTAVNVTIHARDSKVGPRVCLFGIPAGNDSTLPEDGTNLSYVISVEAAKNFLDAKRAKKATKQLKTQMASFQDTVTTHLLVVILDDPSKDGEVREAIKAAMPDHDEKDIFVIEMGKSESGEVGHDEARLLSMIRN